MDAARVIAAEIVGHRAQALVLEEAQHEVGILRPDRLGAFGDVAAAEHLDLHALAHAAYFDQLVDELLHREVAEPRGLGVGTPASGLALGQHEVVHAADPDHRIADAGGDARAEHGDEHLVGLSGHVELAREHLDHPGIRRRIEEAARARDPHAGIGGRCELGHGPALYRSDHASLR